LKRFAEKFVFNGCNLTAWCTAQRRLYRRIDSP